MIGYRPAKLVKMEILIAGKKEEAFSKIVAEDEAYFEGKKVVEKLKLFCKINKSIIDEVIIKIPV
jgi:GTP-binding protein LepA